MINRIFFSDNGTLTDKTASLNNYHANTEELSIVDSEDFLYISSELPLNHLYFDIDSGASTAMTSTVQIYDGNAWSAAVDTIDETNGMTQSGFITWIPNDEKGWGRVDTDNVTALSSITIYGKYWARIAFGSTNTVTLNWLGNLFSDDNSLADKYPALNTSETKTSFESGKTTWKEQHIVVAQDIVNNLKSRGTILDRAQILERRQLTPPAVHKLAALIFNSFGDAYIDQADRAMSMYRETLNQVRLVVDNNASGAMEPSELKVSKGVLVR